MIVQKTSYKIGYFDIAIAVTKPSHQVVDSLDRYTVIMTAISVTMTAYITRPSSSDDVLRNCDTAFCIALFHASAAISPNAEIISVVILLIAAFFRFWASVFILLGMFSHIWGRRDLNPNLLVTSYFNYHSRLSSSRFSAHTIINIWSQPRCQVTLQPLRLNRVTKI